MAKLPSPFPAIFAFLMLSSGLALAVSAFQDPPKENTAFLPESMARKSAISQVMPIYPKDAVRSGRSGIVHVMLEIDTEGDVSVIKVKPRTDAGLSKVTVDAVKLWKFKPWISLDGLPKPVLSRLIFRFTVTDGDAAVELYSPQPDRRIDECMECTNTARELREWRDWNEAWRNESKP